MTFLLIIAALVVALIPGVAGAVAATYSVGGFGPSAADRAGKRAVAVFVIVYGLSAWGLIEWWVL